MSKLNWVKSAPVAARLSPFVRAPDRKKAHTVRLRNCLLSQYIKTKGAFFDWRSPGLHDSSPVPFYTHVWRKALWEEGVLPEKKNNGHPLPPSGGLTLGPILRKSSEQSIISLPLPLPLLVENIEIEDYFSKRKVRTAARCNNFLFFYHTLPSDWSLRATAAANLLSPPKLVVTSL